MKKIIEPGQSVPLKGVISTTPTVYMIGCGWDVNPQANGDYDLDAVAFALGADGQAVEGGVLYYNLPKDTNGGFQILGGAVKHTGDNRTGEGAGDDESIVVDTSTLPEDVVSVVIGIDLYNADANGQHFGFVENAFVRVFDPANDTGNDEVRYELGTAFNNASGVLVAKLNRNGEDWALEALGQTSNGGLKRMAMQFNAAHMIKSAV